MLANCWHMVDGPCEGAAVIVGRNRTYARTRLITQSFTCNSVPC